MPARNNGYRRWASQASHTYGQRQEAEAYNGAGVADKGQDPHFDYVLYVHRTEIYRKAAMSLAGARFITVCREETKPARHPE